MTKTKRGVPRRPVRREPSPIDKLFEETVRRHVENVARDHRENERIRLAPRRRLSNFVFPRVLKELQDRQGNGIKMSDERVAEFVEKHMKALCKDLGLEPAKIKQQKEEKES